MTVLAGDVEGGGQSGEIGLRCGGSASCEEIGIVGCLVFVLDLWNERNDHGRVVDRNGDHELRALVWEVCGLPRSDSCRAGN